MKKEYDLSQLPWTLSGYTPHFWRVNDKSIDVGPLPARVPGSVQAALRDAGILPDWNVGTNARLCEWVENRHWIYETRIPSDWRDPKRQCYLHCEVLDYSGWIFVNDQEVGGFEGTHVPHVFDLTPFLKEGDNRLQTVFDLPPRWLGQFGYTSQMTKWKPRFNYTWDWTARLVQIGICGSIRLVSTDGNEVTGFRTVADADLPHGKGLLRIQGTAVGEQGRAIELTLEKDGRRIARRTLSDDQFADQFVQGITWDDLPVEFWWPNGQGAQPLYTVRCRLLDVRGTELDCVTRRVGFRHIAWVPCADAPAEADPWVCVVNGRPLFLQGVNFAPIRPNWADLIPADYAKRVRTYRDLGANILRINACGFLEKECFYDLCDELGILVWQDFPLTSSGIENWPPEDETSIAEVAKIARSFIERRQHHASLAMWSGGNELAGDLEGRKTGTGLPCDLTHPMLQRLKEVVAELDPDRRYVPSSPSGSRQKAVSWDEHGPYFAFETPQEAEKYWSVDCSLFRSELCCPGAGPASLIRRYKGEFKEWPPTLGNPYWTRPTPWWVDWPKVVKRHGREPANLEEYIAWSQDLQAESLSISMAACKARFPACGGVILWGSHDTFPMPSNAAILDFNGDPKPAAVALAGIWKVPALPTHDDLHK